MLQKFPKFVSYLSSTSIVDHILPLKISDCTEYYAKFKNIVTKFTAKSKPISSNITKEERKALHLLRKDDSYNVLTADKGVVLVIIDKGRNIGKCMALLNDEEVYHEYRDEIKSNYSKVVKLLLDLTILLDQRINTSNIILQVMTDLLPDSIVY